MLKTRHNREVSHEENSIQVQEDDLFDNLYKQRPVNLSSIMTLRSDGVVQPSTVPKKKSCIKENHDLESTRQKLPRGRPRKAPMDTLNSDGVVQPSSSTSQTLSKKRPRPAPSATLPSEDDDVQPSAISKKKRGVKSDNESTGQKLPKKRPRKAAPLETLPSDDGVGVQQSHVSQTNESGFQSSTVPKMKRGKKVDKDHESTGQKLPRELPRRKEPIDKTELANGNITEV